MNDTNKPSLNTMGVTPSQWEQIKNLQWLLNELERKLIGRKDNKLRAIQTKGKPISTMCTELSDKLTKESLELYGSVKEAFRHFNDELALNEDDVFSVCCGMSPENLGDYDSREIGVCPKCKEHTEFV